VIFLAGADWSKVVDIPAGADPLSVQFQATGPNGALGSCELQLPTQTTPADPTRLPFGLGCRHIDEASGKYKVHIVVDHEPAIDRRWRVELTRVEVIGAAHGGDYRFCVEAGPVRSGWSAAAHVDGRTAEDADPQRVASLATEVHDALERIILFWHDVDQDRLFRALDGATALERLALEPRYQATYHRDLRGRLNELGDGDRRRALGALDKDRPIPPATVSVSGTVAAEGPWIPGEGPKVVLRWQHVGTLAFDLAVARPEGLEAKSATQDVALTAGPFRLCARVSSVGAASGGTSANATGSTTGTGTGTTAGAGSAGTGSGTGTGTGPTASAETGTGTGTGSDTDTGAVASADTGTATGGDSAPASLSATGASGTGTATGIGVA
jgi:hypothetical protein